MNSSNRRPSGGGAARFFALASIGGALLVAFAAGGAEPVRLTKDEKLKFSPVFVADGKEVIYAVQERPNLVTLKRLNLATKRETRLFPLLVGSQFDPAISKDGRYLCFAQSVGNPQLVLTIKDMIDSKEHTFSPGNDRAGIRHCSLTPDARRVVFSMSAPGGQQIASVDMKGSDLRRLTESAGLNGSPKVSPDGTTIVFASSRDGDFDLFVMTADGDNERVLVKSPGLDTHPCWSPDGKRLAFTTNRDGNYEIYVCDADGSGAKNLTNHPERDDFPSWSPDGRSIVAVCERAGRFDLYLFEAPP